MKRLIPSITVITLAAAAVAPAVHAQKNRVPPAATPRDEIPPLATPATDTDVAVAGTVVMRMRAPAGGFTPEQRAATIRDRLIPILSIRDLNPNDVKARVLGNGQTASIWVRDRFLVTVGEPLARANNTTPEALARRWAENLRDTLPKMSVKPAQLGQFRGEYKPRTAPPR